MEIFKTRHDLPLAISWIFKTWISLCEMSMQKHQTHKGVEGFTLVEMLIAIAIIGTLAAVAIPKYNQYKIRGYDTSSKQTLNNIYKLCNAYWIDTNPLEACDLSTIKSTYYGFHQHPDVTATLSPLPRDKFCASATHKDSTSTYSIDSASLISSGNTCGGVVSPVKQASLPTKKFVGYEPLEITSGEEFAEDLPTFETYEVPESCGEGVGAYALFDKEGRQVPDDNGTVIQNIVCSKKICGPGGEFEKRKTTYGAFNSLGTEKRLVCMNPADETGNVAGLTGCQGNCIYDFKTNIITNFDQKDNFSESGYAQYLNGIRIKTATEIALEERTSKQRTFWQKNPSLFPGIDDNTNLDQHLELGDKIIEAFGKSKNNIEVFVRNYPELASDDLKREVGGD